MKIEKYESPEIKVVSIEPDESLMTEGSTGGYSSGVEDKNS